MISLILRTLFSFYFGKQKFLPCLFTLALILLIISAEAQIIYTDLNPDQTFNTNNAAYNLDLNKDGITDFTINCKFTTSTNNGCTGSHTDKAIKITPATGNAVAVFNGDPAKLTSCDQVNATSIFQTSQNQILANYRWQCKLINGNNMWKESKTGNWMTDASDKFLGLKIKVGLNTHYGWARMDVSSDAGSFTIKEYGCSNIPDATITMGGKDIIWQKTFGGIKTEMLQGMDKTSDGGFIMAGYTASSASGDVSTSHGKNDFWIVKINADGTLAWQKLFGGSGDETAQAIRQTSDGGYVVTGSTNSDNGDVSGHHSGNDVWVVKLDNAGNIQWQKCFGGSDDDLAYSLVTTSDGGCAVAGTTRSSDGDLTDNHASGDYWLIKMDASGNLKWQKTYGGSAYDFAHALVQSNDGGYLLSGYARSGDGDVVLAYGQEDLWILKLDTKGNIVWQTTYGGTGGDGASSAQQTTDGGYIITGITHSWNGDVMDSHGVHDMWLLKIDSTGKLEWKECIGGSATDDANAVCQTSDGGFMLTGTCDSNDGDFTMNHGKHDFGIVKLNASGSIEWQKSVGGMQDEEPYSVMQSSDGNYVVAGYSSSNDKDVSGNHGGKDFWIVKISASVQKLFYADEDGDGYGNKQKQITACSAPTGYVADFTDCNDSNNLVHPHQTDVCNGIDDDCEAYTDEDGLTAQITPINTVTICNTSSFEIQCTSTNPSYTYQWYKKTGAITGATNTSCVASSESDYWVIISNGTCTANSRSTYIREIQPVATITPAGQIKVCPGEPMMFKVDEDYFMTYQWYNAAGIIPGATDSKYVTTTPGSYYGVKSDAVGCNIKSDTSILSNNPAPAVSVTVVGDLNICTSGYVTLQAQQSSGCSYKWYKDNVAISAATGPTYVANLQGDYKYLATNTNGCTAYSETETVISCGGLHRTTSNDISISLKAFPNPVTRSATIQLHLSKDENVSLNIYDATGRLIRNIADESMSAGDHEFEWDVRDNMGNEAKSGMYLLLLQSEEAKESLKLIVVK